MFGHTHDMSFIRKRGTVSGCRGEIFVTVFCLPISAWMNGLEICAMEVDTGRASLILSAGVSTRYIYSGYQKTPAATQEAEAWEAAKKASGGLHFLAIQENLNSDGCVGFWLLLDLPPPPV